MTTYKNTSNPPLKSRWVRPILLSIGVSAAFYQGSATAEETSTSTIDNPTPYRHLDWVSPEEMKTWPESQRPKITGCCTGLYLPPSLPNLIGDISDAPIKATADRYNANGDGNAVFDGNVIIQHGDRQLEGDHIELHQTDQTTYMEGNVRIRQNGMLMTGDKATFSLNSKELDISNAQYVVHGSHIHGEASRIYNEGEAVLKLDQGSYTTCEPDSNAWLFEANDITLNNASGWGTATHATLKVKDVPVFYFPWVMFPIDDRRQTGFLFPTISSSDEGGTEISAPLYLNIAPNADATLTFRNFTQRGQLLDGEFRYLLPWGEGQIGGSYLPDDKLTGTDRKLTLFTHQGSFAPGWSANIDYTHVSDDDYFSDLDTTLSASSQTHLDQKALLQYQDQTWKGSILVQDYQTIDALIADSDKPYRKLPQIRFSGNHTLSRYADGLPLTFNWLTEFTHFEHSKESSDGIESAKRTLFRPSFTYNVLRPWGYLTPKLEGFFSNYELEGSSTTFDTAIADNTPNLQSYTASLDSGLIFERPFAFGNSDFIQTLEPRLFYLYSPYVNQNNTPTFDTADLSFSYNQMFRNNRFSGGDRVGDANQVSLAVTTRFLEKDSGTEKLRISLGQSFYLEDRKVQLDAATTASTDSRSAIVGRIVWPYSDALTLHTEIQWDNQRNQLDKTDVQLTYRSNQQQIFNAAYRQQGNGSDGSDFENTLEQADFSTAWSFDQHWSIASRWLYDIKQQRTFEGLVGITYDSCCWTVQLLRRGYLKEDTSTTDSDNMRFRQGTYLQFQFKGLGGIGNALESILDNAIYGYEQRRQALSNQF